MGALTVYKKKKNSNEKKNGKKNEMGNCCIQASAIWRCVSVSQKLFNVSESICSVVKIQTTCLNYLMSTSNMNFLNICVFVQIPVL